MEWIVGTEAIGTSETTGTRAILTEDLTVGIQGTLPETLVPGTLAEIPPETRIEVTIGVLIVITLGAMVGRIGVVTGIESRAGVGVHTARTVVMEEGRATAVPGRCAGVSTRTR